MSSKALPSFRDESRDLHKHIGCMGGIFQIFDRHYFIVGRRPAGHNHKRLLPPGTNNNGETNSARDKATTKLHVQVQGKNVNKEVVVQDQPRASTESLGTSYSSSSCSSTFSSSDQSRPPPLNHTSSLDKPAQERRSWSSHFGQQSSDLRDVVKDSMQREQRGVLIKTAAREEGRGRRTIKHIDSPRPIQQFQTGEPPRVGADIDRSNRLPVKLREFPHSSKEDKDVSLRQVRKDPARFSYDGIETRDKYNKLTAKLKESPRFSLDSRESSLRTSPSESRLNLLLRELQRGGNETLSQIVSGNQDPGTNKRPSNVVVKLMGLEAFPDSVPCDQEETIKVSSTYLHHDYGTRSVKKSEKREKNLSAFQQNAHKDPVSPGSKRASSGMKPTSSPRFPLEVAPWRQPEANHESPRTTQNMWSAGRYAAEKTPSVYGEIEKRISELEFKKSGKDLRALKQILEAMQTTRKRLEYQEGEQTELKSQTSRFSSNREGSGASELSKNQENQLAPIKGAAATSPKRFNSPILMKKSARLTDRMRISTAPAVPSADANTHPQKPGAREILCRREDSLDKHITKDLTPRKYTPQNPNKGNKPSPDKSANGDVLRFEQTTRGPQPTKVEKYTALGRSSGSVSPRFQQKSHEIEHQPCLTTPTTPDLGRARRKLDRQLTENDSSKRKPRQRSASHKSKDKSRSSTDSNNFSIQSDTASIQSESNCSLASLSETEVASTGSSTEIKAKQQAGQNVRHGSARLNEDIPLAQLKLVPTEQPSPVSVLDATFYREDSPSPVRKISTAFQDYETSDPDGEWHYLDDSKKKLEKINHLVNKLRLLNTMPDEASMYHVASICKSPGPCHKYITKVLLASGLLKDIGPISTAIQLQSPGHLINPDLFHVLEQTEQSTKSASEEQKQRIAAVKCDQKMHRRIIFDTINEILIRKLASDNPFVGKNIRKTGLELLRELYSEVDRLQAKPESSLEDPDGSISILNADMMQQPNNWVDNQSEIPAVVLDIERLIFKDLITEVITAEAFH